MSPLCVLVMFLCLQSGPVSAFSAVQTLNFQVEYGESAILPCNGSTHLEEDGSVQWETSLGDEVATLQKGAQRVGDSFKFRVELPSEEQLSRGDWSLLLHHTMLSDSGTYQCVWEGRRQGVVSIVWLSVKDPPIERSLWRSEGDTVILKCFLQISSSQTSGSLQAWWTRNGSTLVSTEEEAVYPPAVVYNDDTSHRVRVPSGTLEEFHLIISPTLTADSGEYRCWYKTRDSQPPRAGFPDRVQLTVEERHPAATHHWLSSTDGPVRPRTDQATETTTSSLDVIPVLLEDSTELIEVELTESQPMEAFEETMTFFPDEGTSSESLQWDSLPWVRIGLISGVLLLTAVALCALKAQQKI